MRVIPPAAMAICAVVATFVNWCPALAAEMVISPGVTAALRSGPNGGGQYGVEVALLKSRSGATLKFLGGVAAVTGRSFSLQLEPVFEFGSESGLLAGVNPGVHIDWRAETLGVDVTVWCTPFGWHIASPLFPFARASFQAGGSSWEVGVMLKIPIFFKL